MVAPPSPDAFQAFSSSQVASLCTCTHITLAKTRLITTERDTVQNNHRSTDKPHDTLHRDVNRTFLHLSCSTSSRFMHYRVLKMRNNLNTFAKFCVYEYSSRS